MIKTRKHTSNRENSFSRAGQNAVIALPDISISVRHFPQLITGEYQMRIFFMQNNLCYMANAICLALQ